MHIKEPLRALVMFVALLVIRDGFAQQDGSISFEHFDNEVA